MPVDSWPGRPDQPDFANFGRLVLLVFGEHCFLTGTELVDTAGPLSVYHDPEVALEGLTNASFLLRGLL